jgi:Domain of unknown function (DUF4259)
MTPSRISPVQSSMVFAGHGNVTRVGTWGPGAFDNDDALDLLDTLTRQDPVSRRKTLERIFRMTREHPQDLNWTLGPAEVVAAAAATTASTWRRSRSQTAARSWPTRPLLRC